MTSGRKVKVVAVSLLAFGLLLLGMTARSLWRGLQARSWQTTDGVVLGVQPKSLGNPMRRPNSLRGPREAPIVAYQYRVGGETYSGSRHNLATDWVPDLSVAEAQGRYVAGSAVTVHFDPANPRDAVLSRAASSSPLLGFGLGALCVAGAVLLGIRSRRS